MPTDIEKGENAPRSGRSSPSVDTSNGNGYLGYLFRRRKLLLVLLVSPLVVLFYVHFILKASLFSLYDSGSPPPRSGVLPVVTGIVRPGGARLDIGQGEAAGLVPPVRHPSVKEDPERASSLDDSNKSPKGPPSRFVPIPATQPPPPILPRSCLLLFNALMLRPENPRNPAFQVSRTFIQDMKDAMAAERLEKWSPTRAQEAHKFIQWIGKVLGDRAYGTGSGGLMQLWVEGGSVWEKEMLSEPENRLVVYSKTYCPFSKRAKALLKALGVPHRVVEVDIRTDSDLVKEALSAFTGHSTFPNVILAGESLGGADDLDALHSSGRLEEMLKEKGLLKT